MVAGLIAVAGLAAAGHQDNEPLGPASLHQLIAAPASVIAAIALLLGEPPVLILDEPTNGLDPEGVHWLREFLRAEADRGVTVLVSSHLLAEVAQTVDQVVIVNHGRLVTSASLAELTARTTSAVIIRTPDADLFGRSLETHGLSADLLAPDVIKVNSTTPEHVSRVIAGDGLVVYEMSLERSNLEDIYLSLTRPDTQPEGSRT